MKNGIKKIDVTRLKDRQFVEFALEISRILQQYGKNLGLEPLEKVFTADYKSLEESYRKLKPTLYTEKITELDGQRDNSFRMLYKMNAVYLLDKNPEKKGAAHEIETLIKLYGGAKLTQFDLSGETAALDNLIGQLNKFAKNALKTLGLEEIVEQLKTENNAFRKAYEDRLDFQAENAALAKISDLRKKMGQIFSTVCKNAQLLPLTFPDKKTEVEAFVHHLEGLITKFHPLTLPKKKQELLAKE